MRYDGAARLPFFPFRNIFFETYAQLLPMGSVCDPYKNFGLNGLNGLHGLYSPYVRIEHRASINHWRSNSFKDQCYWIETQGQQGAVEAVEAMEVALEYILA